MFAAGGWSVRLLCDAIPELLATHLPAWPPARLPACFLPTCLFTHQPVCLAACLPACLPFTYLSARPTTCLCILGTGHWRSLGGSRHRQWRTRCWHRAGLSCPLLQVCALPGVCTLQFVSRSLVCALSL